MKWIGLTGGIGTGKTTVANLLKSKNIPVINADDLAHQVLEKNTVTYQAILSQFGPDILDENKNIDRKKLGEIVFQDKEKLKWLEEKIHPEVRAQSLKQKQELESQGVPIAIYDVPLLYEKHMEQMFDKVIVVASSQEDQIQRVLKRSPLSQQQIENRIANQLPLAEKINQADHVIMNSGTLEELEQKVTELIKNI